MESIAIIGIGCRFPGANNPESFWQLLCNGVDAIAEVPKERWDIDEFYDPEPGTPGKMSTRWGGFLDQVDQFDPAFFGISPREVERMDPQQRLVLEVAWEAIENAGLAPEKLDGSQTSVFMGIGNYDYCRLLAGDFNQISAYDGTGNTLSIAANRLSYTLNLRGPSAVVETACSSSLVALHFACRSLQSGESDLSLVGGASLMLAPGPFITYSHARMMASDGRCKTFDASADGYVRGEGCGVVVLKRLSDALKDGDNILAVVRGTAVNQDGLSNGLTAPNGPSQQAVIRQALKNAGVSPAEISYVETHGTGTSLGDPIEFKSLKAVLMQDRQPDQPCWLGSLKTNIGHLEAASGIASVIKVVLSLQHQTLPAHLHLKQLNPYISLDGTTFSIPTETQPWHPGIDRRLAGISAFGFGGTNCHVILEEAPKLESGAAKAAGEFERLFHLLTLSAKSDKALRELAQRYATYLETHPEASLADVCFTANTGRSHFDYRLAAVASSTQQLRQQLEAFAEGKEAVGLVSAQISGKRAKVAFLFTGQGSQYAAMGRQLYETQPTFRRALDRCDQILRPYLGQPLLEVLYLQERIKDTEREKNSPLPPDFSVSSSSSSFPVSSSSHLLDETAYTQPALFALEYALAQLWRSWGVEPTSVMGHSVGEYVAACLAGVFNLEDGLKLIAERARLMQSLPQDGAMVAAFASEAQVAEVIQPYAATVAIAAINGPQSIVISGQRDAVDAVVAALKTNGIKTKPLTVSHAFHSPLMEPMLEAFEKVASEVTYASPSIKLVSNVTGAIAPDDITTPDYWCRHVLQPVRFAQSINTLHQQKHDVFVEIGPKPTLSSMGRYCIPDEAATWLPSLYPKQDDWQQILQSLAALYVRGVAVDWSKFDQDYSRRRLQLPTYPFQRQRYWADIAEQRARAARSPREPVKSSITPIIDLLNEGNTQQLVQQLQTTGKLSADELAVLPKLLELLVNQNKQQLTTELVKDWLYEIDWQLKPRHTQTQQQNGAHQPGSWLILADFEGVGQSLANCLQEQGNQCILVYPGDTYRAKDAGIWSINPSSSADFDRLFQEAATACDRPLQGIIHLWSLDARPTDELTIPALDQAQLLGVSSVLHLLQALRAKHSGTSTSAASSPHLWFVTRNATAANGSLPAIAQAPLWGLGKVIALEHPELWGGMLDLAPEAPKDEAVKLFAEIKDSQGEDHVAFRDGQRYAARLVKKQPAESNGIAFKANSTYLITGGLGALGLNVARWMVEHGAQHLVLTGRRGVSNEAQETLNQLEQLGAKVFVIQADVSNEGDMVKALEMIEALMPPLKGIIHAAGLPGYEAIADMDVTTLEAVLRPKVIGTWILHQLTQQLTLDFFVNFSSISSVWGSKGQSHYAAANYFLDAIAHYRHGLGLPALSVNWGPWAGGGMALEEFQTWLTRMGVEGLQPEQALTALGHLLNTGAVQTTVANVDWTRFKDLYEARGKRSLLELLGTPSQKISEQPLEQRSEILQQLEAIAEGDRYAILLTHLQTEVAKVLRLAQLPDPHQGLFDLGMDSLMAVELVGLIRAQLQVDLPIGDFMQASSIEALANVLMKQIAPNVVTSEIAADVLDLHHEAQLDDSIYPDMGSLKAGAIGQSEIASILLTGASGFLGAFLLHELLEQTQSHLHCLVRAADSEAAMQKIQKNLSSYNRWHDHYRSRITPIVGDLSQPRLGLSEDQFEALARQIDVIYHNAATLNFVYPYSALKPTNVLGTQEVLRLACQSKPKPFHYVSTDAVYDSSAYYGREVTEAEPVLHTAGIDLGYTQTKWVSEKLVTIARDRGLPVSIYRPPLIAGDSQTGTWNTDDFTCRFLKGCIQMGSMPNMDCGITLVPVDYVSRAVVYLSRQKESLGKAFHLNNPNFSSWTEVANSINDYGYPVRQIPYEEWENELIEIVGSKDNALSGLLPFFLRRWSDEQLTFAGLGQRRVKLNCQETVAQLAGTSIACPRVDSKLLNTYFSYFIHSQFLDAPKVRA